MRFPRSRFEKRDQPGNIGALGFGRQHEGAIGLAKADRDGRERDQAAGFEVGAGHDPLTERYSPSKPGGADRQA